ncbi:TPA: glycosyltransferase family 4 protein, partial [Vibrio cholerae]
MRKLFIIGPFPEPVHGMSLANQFIYDYFVSRNGYMVKMHDITLQRKVKSKVIQGKFKLLTFLFAIYNLMHGCLKILFSPGFTFYITPPQSIFGYSRIIPLLMLIRLVGKRSVVHIHGAKFKDNVRESSKFYRWLINLSFSFVDEFILLGKSISISHSSILPKSKITVCENGVPLPEDVDIKYIGDDIQVLFLSNLMKDKGIIDFLNSTRLSSDKRFTYHIAGEIEENSREEIVELLKQCKSNVTYYGRVTGLEKGNLLKKADILVLPSYDEGQPLSILEAYSYGCAVVTTNVGGIPDIFQDGINGFACEVGNEKSILSAIERIVSNDISSFS